MHRAINKNTKIKYKGDDVGKITFRYNYKEEIKIA